MFGRRPSVAVAGYRVHDVAFADFLSVLSRCGYSCVADLSGMPANPLKWGSKEWEFAYELIARALGWRVEKVKREVTKAPVVLQLFNASLQMCGLTVLSAPDLTRKGNSRPENDWDTELVDQ